MKNFIKLLQLLSVAFLVTSCAYENDPGLTPKVPAGTKLDNDPLKDKKPAELLKYKYESLTAECTLSAEVITTKESSLELADEAATVTPTPPIGPVVVNAGEKTTLNFMAQVAVNPELDKTIDEAQMKTVVKVSEEPLAENEVILSLVVEPLKFEPAATIKNVANPKIMYVVKHSPKMIIHPKIKMSRGDSEVPLKEITVNEKVPNSTELGTVGLGPFKRKLLLSCKLDGKVTEKEDVKDQWLQIDCSAKPADDASYAEKAAHALNCKTQTAPTETK
jgi:hypothetical protein